MENYQSKKWRLTIDSLEEYENIENIISLIKPDYYCMGNHKVDTDNSCHIHIFFYFNSPTSNMSFLCYFPSAYIEKAYGSIQHNIDYIKKQGIWKDKKGEIRVINENGHRVAYDRPHTLIEGTFKEGGTKPTKEQEKE